MCETDYLRLTTKLEMIEKTDTEERTVKIDLFEDQNLGW